MTPTPNREGAGASSDFLHGYADYRLGLGRTEQGNPEYEDGYNTAHADAFKARALSKERG